MRLPLVLCAGLVGAAALFGISALARDVAPANGRENVATERDLEIAARNHRIAVYQNFREQRDEFDRRNAELAMRVGAWQRAGKPEQDLDKLVAWVRDTTPGARHAATALELQAPSPAPPSVADTTLPARHEAVAQAPQVAADRWPAHRADVQDRATAGSAPALSHGREKTAARSAEERTNRETNVTGKAPATGALPNSQARVAARALPTRPTNHADNANAAARLPADLADAKLPRVVRDDGAAATAPRAADAAALPAVPLHVDSGVAALDRPRLADTADDSVTSGRSSKQTVDAVKRAAAPATPIDSPAKKPVASPATVVAADRAADGIDAQEVAVRVAGFNLALATLEEDAGRRRAIEAPELVTLVERLEALATRAEDLRPYYALAGADERAALGSLESAAKAKLMLAAHVAAARTALEAQSADGVGQVTDQYEHDAEEQLKELARRIDAIRVDR